MENVFVLIPAYNEAAALAAVLEGLRGYRLVVVDDASTDATAAIAAGHGAHLITHPVNLGQGAALATGIAFALARGATHIVTFDADGQHAASDIPRLLSALATHRADIAFGSRFLGTAIGLSKRRRFLLHCSACLSALTTGITLSDTQNGLRAMTAHAAQRIRIRQNRFAHALEIIAQTASLKLRYTEVPTTVTYTAYSKAKGQPLWSGAGILIDLLFSRLRPW